jgi:hypothetical protein
MARVWITDGSVPVFSDTRRLRASHKGLLGLPVRYEGFVDPDVPRGSVEISGSAEDVLFVEAEWFVEFPGGRPLTVDEATPVVLQGLIEGKWMNRLLGTRAWQPASVGNNVLAEGHGIKTTLRALDGAARGETRIEYELPSGGSQAYVARAGELAGENILELVREVLATGEALDAIDLGAIGDESATVNEPGRLKQAARPLPNPLNVIPHRAKERLVRGAIADGIGLPPGTPARLTTTDGSGAVVGTATLSWRVA